MEESKMSITLLPHTPFLNEDGTFNKDKAINYSAQLAGECYEPEGWEKLKNEDIVKTQNRIKFTLGAEHATPYEHINIGMEIVNIPKILAMVLNNERQCATSEKSARYTKIDPATDSNITAVEGQLYGKWIEIFKWKINQKYGNIHNEKKIEKLAQENARYLVTVFASTKMIHTIPWIQLNRIVSFMKKYIEENKQSKISFNTRLCHSFEQFISCLEGLNLLDERAMSNRKDRSLSIFSDKDVEEYFGTSYSTNYKGTFAQLAQAHRHRTLEYSMHLLEKKEFFIPPILFDEDLLMYEWLDDIESIGDIHPQGKLIAINECGTYDKFILKAKERLCSAAQQEIMFQTKATLEKYRDALKLMNHPLFQDALAHSRGARCTFHDYTCAQPCNFPEGVQLTRKV